MGRTAGSGELPFRMVRNVDSGELPFKIAKQDSLKSCFQFLLPLLYSVLFNAFE
jgi:hypothetical protein